jgi:hypothetical protein
LRWSGLAGEWMHGLRNRFGNRRRACGAPYLMITCSLGTQPGRWPRWSLGRLVEGGSSLRVEGTNELSATAESFVRAFCVFRRFRRTSQGVEWTMH